MELSELTAYAKEKYGIREERGYQSFPNCSVLSHPRTGGWIAFLMRQWDMELGMELERCDIRCGQEHIHEFKKEYLSPPIRMRGLDWIGVALDKGAESDVVFKLRLRSCFRRTPRIYGRFESSHATADEPLSGYAFAVFRQFVQTPKRSDSRAHSKDAADWQGGDSDKVY